ncbi:MAG: NupC/NupG family nucleoside CNT transporter [bacterium]|nr:NupC/NupG family nucleoside CNT transporter [bacterium]
MQFVSFLGLAVLLGIAWAISEHRSKVKLRTVAWGLGLQFLFAVIILRDDYWSFVGMAVLGTVIGVYLLSRKAEGGHWGQVAGSLVLVATIAAILARFVPAAMGWLLLATVAFLLVNARWSLVPKAQTLASTFFVAAGVGYLVSRGLNGETIFSSLSGSVAGFLNLSDYGARFLFGNLADPAYYGVDGGWKGFGFLFGFKVLPTIIFFGGFMAVLYYLGIVQKVVEAMAHFMRWTLGTSGAETLSCSANIFVGQTEAPLLIRPFLEAMTKSELLTIMVGGFATIAGGVLAGYIAFGVPAGHLIAASVMSAPAALVVGKIIYPETEHSQTAGDVSMPEIDSGSNLIEAASSGISDGLKLAVNVGAMLLGFIALIAVVDVVLNWMDSLIDGRLLHGALVTYSSGGLSPVTQEFAGYFPGSLQTLFGTLLRPLAWVMGVPWADADQVGNLLGIKLSLNEFVAYGQLGNYITEEAISERAKIISTYALCGFANFSSIGIQIGGISAIAPSRRSDLARVGLKAMIGGAIASWITATLAGILIP